ncbi:MAG TPA: histidinol-phosphate transaminase [Acidothermaceae bacterium]|nr:histidinol-phosphate transaminase [Acidothermaceae bacterium]
MSAERGQPQPRADLQGVPTYKPGRRPAAGQRSFKLSSNESPYPPLPSVLDAIAEAAHQTNRYPDLAATPVVEALAERLQVPSPHVVVGCGSVGVATQIVESFAGPGDEVLYAWRSFEAYPIIVQVAGANSVRVPLTPASVHDLEAMAAAITSKTRVIFVCNPNNPTGTAVRRPELEAFLDRVPADCLVVLDEAYREFIRDAGVPDGTELYRDRPNVAVLRTFSKAYGLAGLRVGFAVAHENVADAIRITNVPFSVSAIAQAAAVASLQPTAEKELLERVDATVRERARVLAALRATGWKVPDTEANFVWLPAGSATDALAGACEAAGVVVRPFSGEGVRVTIGEPEANDLFLKVADDAAFGR